jgi:Zn-dependent peptidase ImmA (M78 family)/DNA-binding XRE family transcriptional regulator
MSAVRYGRDLQEARKNLRLSQTAIARRLEVTRQSISAYESGKRDVSARELQILCNLFRIYPDDLLGFSRRSHPVQCSVSDFRMNEDFERLSEHDKREVEEFSERRPPDSHQYFARWKQSFLKYSAVTKKPFGSLQQLADHIRKDFNQNEPPINIYLLLEQLGIWVVATYLEKPAAFVCRADEDKKIPPRILVSSSQPLDRQRFSMVHELAHLLLHKEKIIMHAHYFQKHSEQKEVDADAFAGELLIPRELIKSSIENIKPNSSVEDVVFLLSCLYQVSFLAMVMRLYNLGFIKKSVLDDLKSVKPSKLEGSLSKKAIKYPFVARRILPSLIIELRMDEQEPVLDHEAVRKLQEIAYTRYLGQETRGGSSLSAVYGLEPPARVYEKVAFWVADNFPMSSPVI